VMTALGGIGFLGSKAFEMFDGNYSEVIS